MSTRPQIEMAGFTLPQDAVAAVLSGADLIGLDFHAGSPRAVGFHLGKVIAGAGRRTFDPRRRGFRAKVVASLLDPEEEFVEGVIGRVQPDYLKFCGNEGPDFCESFDYPYMKLLQLRSVADVRHIEAYLGGKAAGFHINVFSPARISSAPRLLRSEILEQSLAHPGCFFTGGITANNVEQLVAGLRPHGVVVCSAIETRPGVKSAKAMHAFVRAVESASR